jgi:hypothetical protein
MTRTWKINVGSNGNDRGFTTTVDAPNIYVAREMANNLYPNRFISPPTEVHQPQTQQQPTQRQSATSFESPTSYVNNNNQVPLVYNVSPSPLDYDIQPESDSEPVSEEALVGIVLILGAIAFIKYFGGIAGAGVGYIVTHRLLKKNNVHFEQGPIQLALCAFLPIIMAVGTATVGMTVQNTAAGALHSLQSYTQQRAK